MMTEAPDSISKHFKSARERLGWAKIDIDLFAEAVKRYAQSCPYERVTDIDPEAGTKTVKYVARVPLPDDLKRFVHRALEDLKDAFDQALFGAKIAIGKGSNVDAHFPWSNSPDDLDRYKLQGREGGGKTGRFKIPPEFWPILRTFEPYPRGDGYPGGDSLIRYLAKIANRKHTINLSCIPKITQVRLPDARIEGGGFYHTPDPIWDPVKNEVVIVVASIHAEIQDNTALHIDISFDEPRLRNYTPVIRGLGAFYAKAEAVINGLEREAVKITS